jgi:3-oxoacyl-[acyl-carrier-protein] synthase-3
MRHAQILSTGSYVPERVVTNAEIDEILGEPTSDWLIENVGIRERRWMTPDQTTSDLVVEASRRALERAGIRPEDLDLLILSTDTPDYLSPGTSVVVQHKLGAVNAGLLGRQQRLRRLGDRAGPGRPLHYDRTVPSATFWSQGATG